MKFVNSADAPSFPFLSQASVAEDGTVYVAGQVGIVPGSNPPRLEETVADQTGRAMGYVRAALEAAGSSLAHIGIIHILHTDQVDYPAINEAYTGFLDAAGITADARPPRTATGAAFLPLGAAVEIYAIAEQVQ